MVIVLFLDVPFSVRSEVTDRLIGFLFTPRLYGRKIKRRPKLFRPADCRYADESRYAF